MAAPVSIAYTHVHSMRIASGAEALAARVLTADGTAGFGFTLNEDAGVARDMAAWDAAARSRNVPLYGLLGGRRRKMLTLARGGGAAAIDPFALGSLERTLAAAAGPAAALLAPNGHAWEIAWCAALAAALPADDVRVLVPSNPKENSIEIPDRPGICVDWSLEPAFSAIRW